MCGPEPHCPASARSALPGGCSPAPAEGPRKALRAGGRAGPGQLIVNQLARRPGLSVPFSGGVSRGALGCGHHPGARPAGKGVPRRVLQPGPVRPPSSRPRGSSKARRAREMGVRQGRGWAGGADSRGRGRTHAQLPAASGPGPPTTRGAHGEARPRPLSPLRAPPWTPRARQDAAGGPSQDSAARGRPLPAPGPWACQAPSRGPGQQGLLCGGDSEGECGHRGAASSRPTFQLGPDPFFHFRKCSCH